MAERGGGPDKLLRALDRERGALLGGTYTAPARSSTTGWLVKIFNYINILCRLIAARIARTAYAIDNHSFWDHCTSM